MNRAVWIGVLLTAACVRPGRPGDDVFTARGLASAFSVPCSDRRVRELGYQVTWYGSEGLRAEQRFDENGPERTRGYLSVSVVSDERGRWMYVSGERIRDASTLPVPSMPNPVPTPQPTPVPGVRRSTGPRRVDPGVVASHARDVVRRCAAAGAMDVQPAE